MGWKYVMFEVRHGSVKRKVPIIFPDFIVHAHAECVIKVMLSEYKADSIKAISAGTVNGLFVQNTAGESTTLNLKADPEDAAVIECYPYCHGLD